LRSASVLKMPSARAKHFFTAFAVAAQNSLKRLQAVTHLRCASNQPRTRF
jgi:hypothetical protein